MGPAVARHYEVLDEAIAAHHGVRPVEQGEGDSVVGAFARASDAVAAALFAQRALASEAWPQGAALRVRMALHTGEAELRGEGNYFGPAVIRCARLRAIANGGQVLVSRATAELVAERLPADAALADLGWHRLKDLGRPEQVFSLCHPGLPGAFGPLQSLDSVPNNLPVQLTTFVGRRHELAELAGLLASTRLLTLTGAGGCGKTRLAVQLAADSCDRYLGGVWLVELAAVMDADRVAAAVAGALGERDPYGELTEAIARRIGTAATLVVLDNCEHVLDAVATLADLLLRRCPALAIVATSREPLGVPGETAWRAPSLSVPARTEPLQLEALSQYDAVRLFLDRATKARPNFTLTTANAPAIAQLCARLDGIPLAIELAAARVRAMTIEQIAGGLDDRFHLLTGGARTVLPRQQTLQASVDWGYALLSEAERVVFRRMTVFAGSFSLDAAEQVVAGDGVERVDVLDLLLGLVDKSMVIADDSGRYRLLETLRQYGAARLVDAGETPAVRDRHLAWAVTVRDPVQDGLSMVRIDAEVAVEVEIDNLRAAFEWAVLRGAADAACWIAGTLARWEALTSDAEEAVKVANRALDLDGGDRRLRLLAMATLLMANFETGDLQSMRGVADEMLEQAGEVDDDRIRCLCLYRAGFVAVGFTRAAELHRETIELAERIGEAETVKAAEAMLAVRHAFRGDWREAERITALLDHAHPTESIRAYNADGARVSVALQTGRFGEARRLADALVGVGGRFARMDAITHGYRVLLDLADGGDSGAAALATQLLEETRRRRVGMSALMCGWVPGAWALRNGDVDTAVSELRAWRAEAGVYPREPAILAQALLVAGAIDEARADLARQRMVSDPGPLAEARITHAEGLVCRAEGDLAEAETRHHTGLSAAHEGGWRPEVVHSLEALAGIAAANESPVECARLAGAAQALRDELGYVLRWPFEQSLLDADLATARAALGDDAFTAAYTEGRGLDEDAAVAYASRARGERRRPTHGWDSLTATEAEVARLAAQGLTNKQIGERLLMGAETVKTHLGRAYAKLDVHTRVGLATAVGDVKSSRETPSQ
jgi:predicted ATPase/DNA-binding CsgD family transcriptional regulator